MRIGNVPPTPHIPPLSSGGDIRNAISDQMKQYNDALKALRDACLKSPPDPQVIAVLQGVLTTTYAQMMVNVRKAQEGALDPPFKQSDVDAIKGFMDQAQAKALDAGNAALTNPQPTDIQKIVNNDINEGAAGYLAKAWDVVWAPH